MHTSTSGGSSETEAKALTVMPARRLPWQVVTMVTPVANRPSTLRNSAASTTRGSTLMRDDYALLIWWPWPGRDGNGAAHVAAGTSSWEVYRRSRVGAKRL